jgi:hypothetical protein
MNNLKLPNPKMMDVAVPANLHVGLHQEEVAKRGWALSPLTASGAGMAARPPSIARQNLRRADACDVTWPSRALRVGLDGKATLRQGGDSHQTDSCGLAARGSKALGCVL